jgi:putative pyruvate formate lyase activating enzyme
MQITLNELKRRVGSSYAALSCCRLCPHDCGVDRIGGEKGLCRVGKIARVASHNVHMGEEPPITGVRGSGTIFFSWCNLRCKFCQNYPISQLGNGEDAVPRRLAEMMLSLEKQGCHNINIVTGSHVVPQFLAGLCMARAASFSLPIVWNSSGYDGLESLKLLDGVVDVYMPDIKYSDSEVAREYSGAPKYWDAARAAIKEMHRQAGDLEIGGDGIAKKGILIRHLVLPHSLAGTEKVLKFISEEISPNTFMSFMSQYFPAHRATGDPKISRRLTREEWKEAEELLHKYGLTNGWVQPY